MINGSAITIIKLAHDASAEFKILVGVAIDNSLGRCNFDSHRSHTMKVHSKRS